MVNSLQNFLGNIADIGQSSALYRDRLANPLQAQELDSLNRARQARQNINQSALDLQRQEFEDRRAERAMERQRIQKTQDFLGNLGVGVTPFNPQGGLSREQIFSGLQAGVSPQALGQIQSMLTPEPSKFQEQMQILGGVSQLNPQMQDLYTRMFGKGGTTVNVGGEPDAFTSEFRKELAKGFGKEVSELNQEAEDFMSQSAGSRQALNILSSNPNINISPTAPLTNQAKSLFSAFLTPEQLENVADFQTLDSQLIRNRFDVTKVLKGAITEQEQAAAQRVAGTPTGTRQGLENTLLNNVAFAELQADEKARRAQFIRQMGEDYTPQKFNEYYKNLGETGQRPTLDGLLNDLRSDYGLSTPVDVPQGIDPELFEFMSPEERALFNGG